MFAKVRSAGFATMFAIALMPAAANAETLRIAAPGDAISLDPHASNISATNYFLSNIYDALVYRDKDFNIAGQMAEKWERTDDTTWIFHLRPDVKFQDGAPLTAADVVFSFDRSRAATSNFKHVLNSVTSYKALDDHRWAATAHQHSESADCSAADPDLRRTHLSARRVGAGHRRSRLLMWRTPFP